LSGRGGLEGSALQKKKRKHGGGKGGVVATGGLVSNLNQEGRVGKGKSSGNESLGEKKTEKRAKKRETDPHNSPAQKQTRQSRNFDGPPKGKLKRLRRKGSKIQGDRLGRGKTSPRREKGNLKLRKKKQYSKRELRTGKEKRTQVPRLIKKGENIEGRKSLMSGGNQEKPMGGKTQRKKLGRDQYLNRRSSYVEKKGERFANR